MELKSAILLYMLCEVCYGVKYHVIDLTHEINNKSIHWPGVPDYNFTIVFRQQFPDFYIESNFIAQAEHQGTHLDSPSHFNPGAWRTQQIPMNNLHGPGVVINVKDKAKSNPDYLVTVDDVMAWEDTRGKIPRNAIIIMNSGWGDKYPNKTLVLGTSEVNSTDHFHFPGWHEDTVKWLLNNRHFNVLGVDTPSTDYGQTKTFSVHKLLAKNYKCGLENMANLDQIENTDVEIFAPVIKTFDGSGGPTRAFAVVMDMKESLSNSWIFTLMALLALCYSYFSNHH